MIDEACRRGIHGMCRPGVQMGSNGTLTVTFCSCKCHEVPNPICPWCDPELTAAEELHVDCSDVRCECPCHFRKARADLLDLRSRLGE